MDSILVTLEVSKLLSGWLNTLAPCRVEERAYTMRSEVRAGRRKSVWVRWLRRKRCDVCTARGPETQGLGARARERTENMEFMLVTLEVSKLLSGWLNEWALCRVERRACDAVWAGREAAGCVGRWQR